MFHLLRSYLWRLINFLSTQKTNYGDGNRDNVRQVGMGIIIDDDRPLWLRILSPIQIHLDSNYLPKPDPTEGKNLSELSHIWKWMPCTKKESEGKTFNFLKDQIISSRYWQTRALKYRKFQGVR